jgi:hypothetical protein
MNFTRYPLSKIREHGIAARSSRFEIWAQRYRTGAKRERQSAMSFSAIEMTSHEPRKFIEIELPSNIRSNLDKVIAWLTALPPSASAPIRRHTIAHRFSKGPLVPLSEEIAGTGRYYSGTHPRTSRVLKTLAEWTLAIERVTRKTEHALGRLTDRASKKLLAASPVRAAALGRRVTSYAKKFRADPFPNSRNEWRFHSAYGPIRIRINQDVIFGRLENEQGVRCAAKEKIASPSGWLQSSSFDSWRRTMRALGVEARHTIPHDARMSPAKRHDKRATSFAAELKLEDGSRRTHPLRGNTVQDTRKSALKLCTRYAALGKRVIACRIHEARKGPGRSQNRP